MVCVQQDSPLKRLDLWGCYNKYTDNSKEHAFFYLSIMLRQLANENAQGECPLSLTLSGSFALSQ